MVTKISKLSSINEIKLYPVLLKKNKLIATWENLLYNYNNQGIVLKEDEEKTEKEISESSIEFINIIENAEELSKTKIPKEVNSINIYSKFWKKLIQINSLNDDTYDLIIKSSPWMYSDLDLGNLSENKIKSLINNGCISPIAKSYINLKESFNGLNIRLLEKRKAEYFKIIDEINFDSNDLELVLKSSVLNNIEKLKIINLCNDEIVVTNNNLVLLCSIVLDDSSFVIKDNILNTILSNNSISVLNRLKLFIMNSSKFDSTYIASFLSSLGGDYSWINDINSKAKLVKNNENRQLLNILTEKNYISSFTERDSDYRVNHKRK